MTQSLVLVELLTLTSLQNLAESLQFGHDHIGASKSYKCTHLLAYRNAVI